LYHKSCDFDFSYKSKWQKEENWEEIRPEIVSQNKNDIFILKRIILMWRNWNPVPCWWKYKMVQPLQKIDDDSLRKIKHTITIWSSNSTSGYLPKRIESKDLNRYLYSNVHSNIIHNSQKVETMEVSISGWMDKQNVVYTSSGILFNHEQKEILTHATTWMTLENIMNSKISQTQEDKFSIIPLIRGMWKHQVHRGRK